MEDLANALVHMKIGTPMLKDPAINRLVQFLYCNSSVFRNCYDHFDVQIGREHVSTEGMPFTCIINADLISEIDRH